MYTFAPIPDVPVDHVGFYVVLTLSAWAVIAVFFNNGWDELSSWVFATFMLVVVGIAFGVSYHWTDQNPKVYKNEPVVGEFVRYVAEGYSESRTSGKTTRQVDVHKVYVIYRVNGNDVLMEGRTGIEYPKFATLYKN